MWRTGNPACPHSIRDSPLMIFSSLESRVSNLESRISNLESRVSNALHAAHGQLQDLAVRKVVHRGIVEVEAVRELLIVVRHEREAEVAVIGAFTEFLHGGGVTVVLL